MNEISSSKLTQTVIGIIVAVMVLGVVLVPVLSQATETEKTFENDNYFKMSKYTTEEVTITFDAANADVVTVNGEDVALPTPDRSVSIVASEIFCLRYNTDKTFQFFSGNSNTPVAVGENWTMTFANGTATFTNTTTSSSRSANYETIYAISNNGDWAMKKSNVPAYMNSDSFFMGVGLTAGSSTIGIVGLNVSGNIDDGATITAWRGTNITFSDIVLYEEAVSGYIDLYKLDKVTFTATDEENNTLDITYSYFIVPYGVTAELSDHPTPMMITLINVIPVFVVLAIILGVCGLFYYSRNENSLI